MSDISKIKWSSEEYTLERFVHLFPLPQVVRIKTNLKGNNERKGQPVKTLSNDVFVLHCERRKEVIRATDSLKNEFYLPHDSTAKVEVIWKDYNKFYDNVGELFDHFPSHVLVVEEDETLGIKKGDVLKLKKKVKDRETNYLKCAFLDANRADVDIPFSYKGVFKTLGDLTSESIPLKEAVEFCRLPRNVKFIGNKLKIKRIDDTSKSPTLLSSLERVTLHEVIDHLDVIASQVSHGQVVVSSIPLVEDVIVNAATAESRGGPEYTRHCQMIDRKTTAEMVKEIGVLHQHWVVFQEDGTKDPSSSWNHQLFSLASLRYEDIPHVDDDNSSAVKTGGRINVDKEAPFLPPKTKTTVSKKQNPPPIPPRSPLLPILHPILIQHATSEREDAGSFPTSSKTPLRSKQNNDNKNARIYFPSEPNKKDKQRDPYRTEGGTHQDVSRKNKERFGTYNLEGEDGYVKMGSDEPHLPTKYGVLRESTHKQAQPDYSKFTSDRGSQGHHLNPNVLIPSKRERSRSHNKETKSEIKKDHNRLQRRRSYDPKDTQRQGGIFSNRESDQNQPESTKHKIPSDTTPIFHYDSEDVHLKIRYEDSEESRELYSEVPPMMVEADRHNKLPILKYPQKMPKAPPGLDFTNSKNVRSWSPREVLKFLKFMNLERYKEVFKQKKIDGEMLLNLVDKKQLDELRVTHAHAATITKFVHECIKHENSTIPQ